LTPSKIGKILVWGWHSELGVDPFPNPSGNSHPGGESSGIVAGVTSVFTIGQKGRNIRWPQMPPLYSVKFEQTDRQMDTEPMF